MILALLYLAGSILGAVGVGAAAYRGGWGEREEATVATQDESIAA